MYGAFGRNGDFQGRHSTLDGSLMAAFGQMESQIRDFVQAKSTPRASRGDVRAAVLALLAEQPMHGYQIIHEIDERSAGT